MSPRLVAAVVIALAAGAGCSSKSSSAPAQAQGSGSGCDRTATTAPAGKPPALDVPAAGSQTQAPLAPAHDHGDFRERMKQFDTDGDGKLSEDERYKMMAARAGEVLARNDTDGDGVLSKAEFEASPAARRVGDFAA